MPTPQRLRLQLFSWKSLRRSRPDLGIWLDFNNAVVANISGNMLDCNDSRFSGRDKDGSVSESSWAVERE